MKEKLSTELKALVGENSLSQRTFNDYLDNVVVPFAPSDETAVSDFVAKHASVLKSLNGQLNHDIASKVDEFKKSYNPSVNVKEDVVIDTLKTEKVSTVNGLDPAIVEQLKELSAFKASYEANLAAHKQELEIKSLRDGAILLAKERGAVDSVIVDLVVNSVPINQGDSVEAIASSLKAAYDAAYTKLNGGGYNPAGFSRGGVSGADSYKAYKERKQREGKLPK